MTIEQKRRELFERDYCSRHGCGIEAMMKSGKMYLNSRAQTAWYWFNAALDAVVIELPGSALTGGEGIDACRAAIESTGLGLKVKP